MGASCCGGEEKNNKDVNFMRKGEGKSGNRRSQEKLDDQFMKTLPIFTVVREQALIRGYLSRKRIKRVYGFEMTPGLLNRGTVHIEMDPEKLEEQR